MIRKTLKKKTAKTQEMEISCLEFQALAQEQKLKRLREATGSISDQELQFHPRAVKS
jgi:hypothetical protein